MHSLLTEQNLVVCQTKQESYYTEFFNQKLKSLLFSCKNQTICFHYMYMYNYKEIKFMENSYLYQ